MALEILKRNTAQNKKREELAKILEDRQDSRQAVEDFENTLSELKGKRRKFEEEFPEFTAAAERAEGERRSAVDAFVLGKISQQDLDAARSKADRAKSQVAELTELMEAIGHALEGQERQRSVVDRDRAAADHRFWQHVLEELTIEIQPQLDLILKAYAAFLNSKTHFHGSPRFAHFLASIFEVRSEKGQVFALDTPQGAALAEERARGLMKEVEAEFLNRLSNPGPPRD
ncbi:MAG: hypothetical protein QY316_06375 [Thermodesulfobacteriota bacterium]|nr:MAG: hypothetical protein QY316_06375 [Thermodesulfobacteriota bacterium]